MSESGCSNCEGSCGKMDEFTDRMEAQRQVLDTVNHRRKLKEELCGLSQKAIERWLKANGMEPDGEPSRLLTRISGELFFLAHKSQEQISEEYGIALSEITRLRDDLRRALD